MALRLLLVGLVTCLGMEPPSSDDLHAWVESGREFWIVRMIGEEEIAQIAVDQDVPAEQVPGDAVAPPVVDLASKIEQELADDLFAAIADDLATSFLADRPAPSEAIVQAPAPAVEVRDDAALPEPEVVAQARDTAPPANEEYAGIPDDEVAAITAGEAAVAEGHESDSRADQVANALRLTGDALHAWANLIQSAQGGPSSQH